jgi:hypothetical protein
MENRETLLEAVKAAAVDRDGRTILACTQAFKIAETFSVSTHEIGELCNEAGIKIAHCQLGCF